MKIELKEVSIQDIIGYSPHLQQCQGYEDNGEGGVFGMAGRLNIRPAYQREFVYKDKQREAVINTVRSGFPLNMLYWVVNDDGSYEVLDGQQRIISIGQYLTGGFALDYQFFHNLTQDQIDQILNYKLMVYFCEGTDSEKLDWFKTINIAGEKLTDQELRNALYTGPWLEEAKKYFSRVNCPVHKLGSKYLKGSSIRQDFLETTLKWTSGGKIEEYMGTHQHDTTAEPLWDYFGNSLAWFKGLFPTYRKEMKGIPFGELYNTYKDAEFNSKDLEEAVDRLMLDDDVTKKAGIYIYLITGDEKNLNIRAFSNSTKREVFELQGGECPHCGKFFDINEMEADHIIPWSEGGKTITENCQMLCKNCNRTKSNK